MSRNRCCDCGKDRREWYMVNDALWTMTGLGPRGGCLCIGCLERRIGRRLQPADFTDAPINTLWDTYDGMRLPRKSRRLRQRLTGRWRPLSRFRPMTSSASMAGEHQYGRWEVPVDRSKGIHPLGVPIVATLQRAADLMGVDPSRLARMVARARLDPWGVDGSGQPVWRWAKLVELGRQLGAEVPPALAPERRSTLMSEKQDRGRANRKHETKQP